MTESKIVTITPYSEEWCRCMANANWNSEHYIPNQFKRMSPKERESAIKKYLKEKKDGYNR